MFRYQESIRSKTACTFIPYKNANRLTNILFFLILALSDINEAVKDVTSSTSKFHVVTVTDFYLQVAELKIISGQIEDARAALTNVPGGRPDFEDRISYLEQCISRAEVTMGEGYSMKHVTSELVFAMWHQAMAEIYLASDIAPECAKVRLLKAEILVIKRDHFYFEKKS